jgi:hypothetical protein
MTAEAVDFPLGIVIIDQITGPGTADRMTDDTLAGINIATLGHSATMTL